MSRSTDASPGTPDDGEGPLDDAVTGNGDAGADSTDDIQSDEVETDDAGADEPDAVETDDSDDDDDSEDEDVEDEVEAPVPAVAGRGARGKRESAVARRSAASRPVARASAAPTTGATTSRNPIAALVLFVRQVISELRKVVTPTSKELGTYVAVVIVFVIVVMAYVGVLDYAVGRLVLWAFGG